MEQTDDVTNRVSDLLAQFAAELTTRYKVPPQNVAKAAVGLAVVLYMEHNTNDNHAAAEFLRSFADELDSAPPGAVN